MPGEDGTGPMSRRPGSGRGRGYCGGANAEGDAFRERSEADEGSGGGRGRSPARWTSGPALSVWPDRAAGVDPPRCRPGCAATPTEASERLALEQQAATLRIQLARVEDRLKKA